MARHKVVIPAGRSFGSKKKRIYIAVTAVMLLLLGMAAAALLHSSAEKRTKEYVQKARESYSAGDYENALLYLRRVKEDAQSQEVLLLMADCYAKSRVIN